MTRKRQITSDILVEKIIGFIELTIQSTINDSEKDDAERNPKVATYTTNTNPPHKLFLNLVIHKIITGTISPMDQTIMEDVA